MAADAVNYALLVEQPAKIDLASAVLWYKKAQPGLELDFQFCFEETLNRILLHPEMYVVLMRHIRRASMLKFPYSVLYRVEKPALVRIIAVLHTGRDPRHFKSRT